MSIPEQVAAYLPTPEQVRRACALLRNSNAICDCVPRRYCPPAIALASGDRRRLAQLRTPPPDASRTERLEHAASLAALFVACGT